jgi:flagellar biosynthesis component FlhA
VAQIAVAEHTWAAKEQEEREKEEASVQPVAEQTRFERELEKKLSPMAQAQEQAPGNDKREMQEHFQKQKRSSV